MGGVMVGLTTAKALALASGKPLIAVNHLMGHALTARLTHGVEFPFLLLLVSGGHCQLLGVGGADASPSAFTTCARLAPAAAPCALLSRAVAAALCRTSKRVFSAHIPLASAGDGRPAAIARWPHSAPE